MSGGHWNYAGARIRDELECIAEDKSVRQRWPHFAAVLAALGPALYDIEKEMDYDLSSDSHIDDDAAFDASAVWSILEPAMKAASEEYFPRGKWATIQAVQARHERRHERNA